MSNAILVPALRTNNPHSGASYDYHFEMYHHYLRFNAVKAQYHLQMATLLAEAG